MRHAGSGNRSDVFQLDRLCAQAIKQPNSVAEEDWRDIDVYFVDQTCRQRPSTARIFINFRW
ncbi:hypothetical protein BURK2_00256 [Burkholderiales bacterium]|nr:hypothetical protein BURK2_00256 [Burkholderiales bacterium]